MPENFPNLATSINPRIPESESVTNRINPEKPKLQKLKTRKTS